MENQVLSLPLCKKFKELGIEMKTEFVWFNYEGSWQVWVFSNGFAEEGRELLPAPTLTELLEIVPGSIKYEGEWMGFELVKYKYGAINKYRSRYTTYEDTIIEFSDNSPIEAVGKLLIYLKENKL